MEWKTNNRKLTKKTKPNSSLERLAKVSNSWLNCTRANKETTQVIRMKNKKCIHTDLKGIKQIIRDYYALHIFMPINSTTYRFGQIFEKYNILLTIKNAGNVNSLSTGEIQCLMKNLPTHKLQAQTLSLVNPTKHLKKK